MKWFICANTGSSCWTKVRLEFIKHAMVAISTCPPDLEPICVLDLSNLEKSDVRFLDRCLAWIGKRAQIIHHSLSFTSVLKEIYGSDSDTAIGAHLRCDIPLICDKLGIKDQYVLYSDTDTDVMFVNNNVSYLFDQNPEFLTASVESDPNDWNYFNSGVLLMNVQGMKSLIPEIIQQLPYNMRVN